MNYKQARHYAKHIRALPQVKAATAFTPITSARNDCDVRVEDYLGTVCYLSGVCETRSLLAIWQQQARAAQTTAAKERGNNG